MPKRRQPRTSSGNQVSCKIMNVRSGAELPEKCGELAAHFESQGTPVMIGGGILAYTLLGVGYNEVSGDCAFLILDPHYTGNDDLKRIVSAFVILDPHYTGNDDLKKIVSAFLILDPHCAGNDDLKKIVSAFLILDHHYAGNDDLKKIVSAFLILDPHYTGNDDLKKIVSGGRCGWKRAVDSKGRSFFLKDKFYNLLLPKRPNMV